MMCPHWNYFLTAVILIAAISVSGDNPVQKPRKGTEDFRIVYPDYVPKLTKDEKCSYGFCDSVDDYPLQYIHNLSLSQGFLKFFKAPPEIAYDSDSDLNNRFGTDTAEQTICGTRKRILFPRQGENLQGEKRFVVNVDTFKQAINIETCQSAGGDCLHVSLPNGYTASCKQKDSAHQLLAIDQDGKPYFDSFSVPSCCVCAYKKV